ncbi:MAG: class I SAM-dependent methyltransferase [Desulfobacteraceae bacterium]|nr:MAG: class I SAM-dependent methyltransferase [Desulfobacteraceae bacterium]
MEHQKHGHSHVDQACQNEFDKDWKLRFEELGKKDVPIYQKASYETKHSFELREKFIRHLIRESLRKKTTAAAARPLVLDVGCNEGYYIQILAENGFEVCGIDYAESLVRAARKKNPDLPFYQADVYALPFKENTFDLIFSFGVIQCVADWQKALTEIYRVLKPRGVAIVETNRSFRHPYLEKLSRNMRNWIRGEIPFKEIVKKTMRLLQGRAKNEPLAAFLSSAGAPTKHSIPAIIRFLEGQEVSDIVIHDPAKYGLFHHLFWGFSFVKIKNEDVPASPSNPTNCLLCFRSGQWKS